MRATPSGGEPALLVHGPEITLLESNCIPLGMFTDQQFKATRHTLDL